MARVVTISFETFGISDSDAAILAQLAEAAGGRPVQIWVTSPVGTVTATFADGDPDFDIDSFFDVFTELYRNLPGRPPGSSGGSTTGTIREANGTTRPLPLTQPEPPTDGGTPQCPRLHYKFDGNPRDVQRGTMIKLDKDVTPECDCLLIVAQAQFGFPGPEYAQMDICVDGIALHLPVAAKTTVMKNLVAQCMPGHMIAVAQVAVGQPHVVSFKIQNFGTNPLPVSHCSLSILEGECVQHDIVPRQ